MSAGELLLQLEALLYRHAELQNLVDPSAAETIDEDMLAKTSELDADDVNQSIQHLRNIVLLMASESLAFICNKLLSFAEKHQVKSAAKVALPGSHDDEEETHDDHKKEDTVEYWILETLKLVMESAGVALLEQVPESVITFCMNRIHYTNSSSLRRIASECIGVLSQYHPYLRTICESLIKRMVAIKKDEEFREYVPYQRCVKLLDFGFRTQQQIEITLSYFNELLKQMQRIERGVMRREVCDTVGVILSSLMVKGTEENMRAWERLNEDVLLVLHKQRFWEMYKVLFDTLLKWSKSSRHTLFVYNLLRFMSCYAAPTFYASGRTFDMMNKIIAGFKEKALREKCLVYAKDWMSAVKKDCVLEQIEGFTALMKSLMGALYIKKTVPPPNEVGVLTDILVEIGRKHVNSTMIACRDFLQPSASFSNEMKAIVLRALSVLMAEFPKEVSVYNDTLFTLVIPYVESPAGVEPLLLRAALRCFPRIQAPSATRIAQTVQRIGALTVVPDKIISNAAIMSLLEYMMEKPTTHLIPILHIMKNVLVRVDTNVDELLSTFNTTHLMLSSFSNSATATDLNQIDVSQWLDLREKLEGIVLIWLCHPETFVRVESFRLLDAFSRPNFRKLEEGITAAPWLADGIAPSAGGTMDPTWAKELDEFLVQRGQQYINCVSFAWLQLSKQWKVDVTQSSFDEERILMWRNHIRFLCMALRKGSLTSQHAESFFRDLLPYIHHEREDVRSTVLEALERLSSSAYSDFLRTLKSMEAERERSAGRKRGATADIPDYYTQEQVLQLFANIISRLEDPAISLAALPTFGDLIRVWLQHSQVWVALSTRVRAKSASILEHYLRICESLADESIPVFSAKEVILLLRALAVSSSVPDNAQEQQATETSLIKAAGALAHRGPIDDPDQLAQFLEFVLSFVPHGHAAAQIESCLSDLLTHNPSLLNLYCDNTVWFNRASAEEGKLVAVYLSALVKNMQSNLALWVFERTMSPSKMMVLAMFHQVSTQSVVRQSGIDLATLLANHDASALHPGFYLPASSHYAMDSYIEAAARYSSSLAFKKQSMTATVLSEFVSMFAKSIPGKALPADLRAVLLRLVTPWVRNIGPLLVTDASQASLAVTYMLEITRKSYPIQSEKLLETMWHEMLLSDAPVEVLVPFSVDFIIRRLAASQTEGDKDLETICKIIVRWFGRSPLSVAVVSQTVGYLRNYPAIVSDNASEYVASRRATAGQQEPISEVERAAFAAVADLAFELDADLIVHLPLLLHNAFALYGRSDSPADAHMLISSLLHSLGIRMASTASVRDAVVDLRNKYFPDPCSATGTAPTPKGLLEFPTFCLSAFVEFLSSQRPDLREEWADIAFAWSLQTSDAALSLSSLRLFRVLNTQFNDDVINKLSLLLFTAEESGDAEKITELLHIFVDVANDYDLPSSCWQTLTGVSLSVLHSYNIQHFACALKILQGIYQKRSADPSILVANDTIWSASMPVSTTTTLDSVIMGIIAKGVTSADTVDGTLWLLEQLATNLSDRLPTNNNIVLSILLFYAVFVGMERKDTSDRAHSFLRSSGYALTDIQDVFRRSLEGRYKAIAGPVTRTKVLTATEVSAGPAAYEVKDGVAVEDVSDTELKQKSALASSDSKSSDFFIDFFKAFAPVFYTEENFVFALKIMEMLLRRGLFEWKLTLLHMFNNLVQNIAHMWNLQQYEKISELVVENCFASNAAVQDVCERTIVFLMSKPPLHVAASTVFNFIRKNRLMRRRTQTVRLDPSVFPVASEADVRYAFASSRRALGVSVLGLVLPELDAKPVTSSEPMPESELTDSESEVAPPPPATSSKPSLQEEETRKSEQYTDSDLESDHGEVAPAVEESVSE